MATFVVNSCVRPNVTSEQVYELPGRFLYDLDFVLFWIISVTWEDMKERMLKVF